MLLPIAADNTSTASSRALVSGFGLVSFWALAFHLASSLSLALLAFSPGESGLRPRALRPDASTRTSSLFRFSERQDQP